MGFVMWATKYGAIAFAIWIVFTSIERAAEWQRAQGRAEICEAISWRHAACSTARR